MRNKYGAIKTKIDGITFASKGEALRYRDLKIMERGYIIKHLKLQEKFPIKVNDKLICNYIADFTYFENGVYVVEDFKGISTPIFRIKAKLFEAIYGYKIRITGRK